jgi:putative hemolysin
LSLAVVSSCGSNRAGDVADTAPGTAAVANPAAEYCHEQGGTSEIVTAADGSQSGICRLADGTTVDDWEYYRASQTPSTMPTGQTSTGPSETTATPEGPVTFNLYLLAPGDDCDQVLPFARTSTVEGALGEALSLLLAGPTPEQDAAGMRSWFSPETAGMLRSVEVENGTATIGFAAELRSTIPNASSSCGSAGLLAQLDATVLQFDSVDKAVYSLDGDIPAFYQWLQFSPPAPD